MLSLIHGLLGMNDEFFFIDSEFEPQIKMKIY